MYFKTCICKLLLFKCFALYPATLHQTLWSTAQSISNMTVCMHIHNRDAYIKGSTCDFKPHGNIRGFGGDNAHHVCHRVAFHYRKGVGGLLKKQRSCVRRQFWFGNPLDMQTTSGRFLRTSIVDGFNLRERQRIKDCVTRCYATLLLQMSFCTAL